MNVLKYPDQADLGAVLSRREFEELAIDAGLVEDLMDRTDLAEHEFLDRAISRANASRTAQNTLLWVTGPSGTNVFLVPSRLEPGIARLTRLARNAKAQANAFEDTIKDLLNGASKP